jgi:hypothetical protein
MDGKLLDGALIDAVLTNVFRRLLAWLGAEGVTNVALQELIIVASFAALFWMLWRVSRLGYRVNETVGVAVEVSTMGAAVTLLAITIPAWAAFRQGWLASAFLSPLH